MNSSSRQIVFIDGVGGKRYMRGKFVRYFERRGYSVSCFDYRASSLSLDEIKKNLTEFLSKVARAGEYHAVAYSFGGVLLRSISTQLSMRQSQPKRVVLLASPIRAMRLARRLRDWKIYRALTGECGQFAADDDLMNSIPLPDMPTAYIYGTWPWLGAFGFFFGVGFPHDGMVAADEAIPSSQAQATPVPASHAFIPSNDDALRAIEQWFSAVA
ncbi:alpha/beta hydrolase [Undibacterium sp. CY18W]|uniref:Alpha/beta hydrolase n=1 Tax=Undibacterium hunanense TaxID=2762292 RepID=A0ABR6ZQR4_9BURK|nr:alpha/beta hydrolase [Undibacterium hunanense]MBC3918212.1 alpha/beta hydrolase [Undibacterium hunanense]